MALTTTTLSSAVAVNDTSIKVASATGFAAGQFVRVDSEFMTIAQNYSSGTTIPVLRGKVGTVTAAHATSANVTTGVSTDFQPAPSGLELLAVNPVTPAFGTVFSYSAAGAIAVVSGIHVINGTGALAMTLANPTKDQDGTVLIVVANGKAAHTLTITSGIGNGGASFDVGTFSASLQVGCILVAVNGFWVLVGNGIAGATAATAGPLWA